jgi:hypothetical protein
MIKNAILSVYSIDASVKDVIDRIKENLTTTGTL